MYRYTFNFKNKSTGESKSLWVVSSTLDEALNELCMTEFSTMDLSWQWTGMKREK